MPIDDLTGQGKRNDQLQKPQPAHPSSAYDGLRAENAMLRRAVEVLHESNVLLFSMYRNERERPGR